MTAAVIHKLLAIILAVALGWLAARRGWLGRPGSDPARVLGDAAFFLFVPALLFRTMARLDLAALPWRTLAAYFVPAIAMLLLFYAWQRARQGAQGTAAALPATRAVAAVYGNGVQLGIPIAAALYGEPGLALHIALVSVHGVLLLTLLTVLVEADLARADPAASHADAAWNTLRNAVVHPVVLPTLAGMAWNLGGLGLHPVVDQALAGLGGAAVPLCLVLIGVTLATYGLRGSLRGTAAVVLFKLLALPAAVLVVAHWGFGLAGMPLGVLVMMAALPVGTNALIFAQRYDMLQAEASTAIVLSTVAFGFTATAWLAVLGGLAA